MSGMLRACVLGLLLGVAAPADATDPALTVQDDLGRVVTFATTPRRIIALGHAAYAQLAALGIRPVGTYVNPGFAVHVDALFTDRTPVPSVVHADWTPDPELIARLRPDLVLGWSMNEAQTFEAIAPFFAIREFRSIADITANLRDLGRILDASAAAEAAIRRFERRLAAYRALAPRDRSVLFVSGRDIRRFQLATRGNMICQLADQVARCGAISPEARLPYVEVTIESLLEADPDVIILGYFRLAGRAAYLEALSRQPLWNALKAVRNGRVMVFDGYQDISIRGLPAAERLLDLIMPRVYPEIVAEPITDARIAALTAGP